eukprot:CCRYP_014621-RA/>CCRYP_014621-RA protein AED:0.38 eAED:0.38 QI:0/-1/0/1/-1/1/1/0/130
MLLHSSQFLGEYTRACLLAGLPGNAGEDFLEGWSAAWAFAGFAVDCFSSTGCATSIRSRMSNRGLTLRDSISLASGTDPATSTDTCARYGMQVRIREGKDLLRHCTSTRAVVQAWEVFDIVIQLHGRWTN